VSKGRSCASAAMRHQVTGVCLQPFSSSSSFAPKGHAGPIVQLEEVENRFHREQRSPGGSRTLRVWETAPPCLAACWGCKEHPRTCPGHVNGGAGSHRAKHDLAGSAGGEKRFDVVSASWNCSLVSSSSGRGEICIAGRRLRNGHTTGGYRIDAACPLAPARCHHPRSHCTFSPRHLPPLTAWHHCRPPGQVHFPPPPPPQQSYLCGSTFCFSPTWYLHEACRGRQLS